MGVSLGYFSKAPITPEALRQLVSLSEGENERYDWWCEGLWISDETDSKGSAFGFTKLFCMIDDEDTDTYMAYHDVREIVRFLTMSATQLSMAWRVEIEDTAFGEVSAEGPDRTLRTNLDNFLNMFPGEFESLKSRTREEILQQWSDR